MKNMLIMDHIFANFENLELLMWHLSFEQSRKISKDTNYKDFFHSLCCTNISLMHLMENKRNHKVKWIFL
jgi:hypothetical protein